MQSRLGRDLARKLIRGVLKQRWELKIGGSGAVIEYGMSGPSSVWQETVVEEDGKEGWYVLEVGDDDEDATDNTSEEAAENGIWVLEIFFSFFSKFNLSFLSYPNSFFHCLTSDLKLFLISAISSCFLDLASLSSMFSFFVIFFWVSLFASASLIWSAWSSTRDAYFSRVQVGMVKNTPRTAGGPGGRDRTLAVKSRKNVRKSPFFLQKIKYPPKFFFWIYLLVMPKYWGKNYFAHGSFLKVGQKQKTEKKERRKKSKSWW